MNNNKESNSLKNSSLIINKLPSAGLDEKGFLETLEQKKQRNQAKV
jgi:hypothetical protein